jgi:hypothetical protein
MLSLLKSSVSKRAVQLSLLCMLLFATEGPGAVRSFNLDDDQGLFRASLLGDQETLRVASQRVEDGSEIVAKALYERSTYHIENSMSALKVRDCGDPALVAKTTGNLYCSMVYAGNLLILGRFSEWAHVMAAAKAAAYDRFTKASGISRADMRLKDFEVVNDFSTWFDFPTMTATAEKPRFSIPIQWVNVQVENGSVKDREMPFVYVSINGQSTPMEFDTGTSEIVLPEQDAAKFHIEDILEWLPMTNGMPTRLGFARDVVVGGLHLKNSPVVITKTFFPTLGVRAMTAMGALKLTGQNVLVDRKGFGDECKLPMNFSSAAIGTGWSLTLGAKVDDKPIHVLVDSGQDGALVEQTSNQTPQFTETEHVEQRTVNFSGVTHQVTSVARQSRFQFGSGASFPTTYVENYGEKFGFFDWTMGVSFLRTRSLTIDFTNGTLCLD